MRTDARVLCRAYGRLNAFRGKRAETLTFALARFTEKKKKGGRGGRTDVNMNLHGPKESLPAARLDAHLFRQSGASSRILANNIRSASFSSSPRLFRSVFLDSVAIRECRMRAAASPPFFFLIFRGCARVCLQGPQRAPERLCQETGSKHTSGNVFSSGGGRNSFSRGGIIMSKQNRSHQK